MTVIAHRRVSPFGHPRIAGRVLLPLAYRSLPRPSSPSCAQASPTCFRSLDHIIVSSRARAIYLIECSTYSTSRVGFVSHDHYLRTVVKQRLVNTARTSSETVYSVNRHPYLSTKTPRIGCRKYRYIEIEMGCVRRRLREDFPSSMSPYSSLR